MDFEDRVIKVQYKLQTCQYVALFSTAASGNLHGVKIHTQS